MSRVLPTQVFLVATKLSVRYPKGNVKEQQGKFSEIEFLSLRVGVGGTFISNFKSIKAMKMSV